MEDLFKKRPNSRSKKTKHQTKFNTHKHGHHTRADRRRKHRRGQARDYKGITLQKSNLGYDAGFVPDDYWDEYWDSERIREETEKYEYCWCLKCTEYHSIKSQEMIHKTTRIQFNLTSASCPDIADLILKFVGCTHAIPGGCFCDYVRHREKFIYCGMCCGRCELSYYGVYDDCHETHCKALYGSLNSKDSKEACWCTV